MRFYLNDMLYAISYALDNVEREYRGISLHHAERVAYMSVQMGRAYGLDTTALMNLAVVGVLHDNAFTEYYKMLDKIPTLMDGRPGMSPDEMAAAIRPHCEMGERNVKVLPFYSDIKNAVLFHHENADGSGAFGISADETPLYARLLQLSDQLDNQFILEYVDEHTYKKIIDYLEENVDHLFTREMVDLFRSAFPEPMKGTLSYAMIRQMLQGDLPHVLEEYNAADVRGLATVIARIIDYKSKFTCTHSLGIARKSSEMGHYLGYDEELCTKLYLAGALHDVGKLTIPSDILEKPDRLTEREFSVMKTHAIASWNILRTIDGLDDVVDWACMHHEKLNGSGYPFGRTADQLCRNARLLCCTDIYQALREERPYKEAISHDQAISVMREMVANGLIDAELTEAMDKCFSGRN
ncbi:MAG TPA: phosphohydrolase [Selenomonas sp.]|nr:phosphohydrolase [Selenomonas sp.]